MAAFSRYRPVTHVLGCHIEMTRRPGRDFPLGATYQPDEAPLEMTVGPARERPGGGRIGGDPPGVHRFDDFIIFNGPCTSALPKMFARALASRLRLRLTARHILNGPRDMSG